MHIAQHGNFTGRPKSMQTPGDGLEDPDGLSALAVSQALSGRVMCGRRLAVKHFLAWRRLRSGAVMCLASHEGLFVNC
jgi:hypothetical protein